jgi:hypothetical protein
MLSFILGTGLHVLDKHLKPLKAEQPFTGLDRGWPAQVTFAGPISADGDCQDVLRGSLALYGTDQMDQARKLLALISSADSFTKALTQSPAAVAPRRGFAVGHPRCRRANENPAQAMSPAAERGSEIPRGDLGLGGLGGTPEGYINPMPFIDALQANDPLTVRQPLHCHAARIGRCADARGHSARHWDALRCRPTHRPHRSQPSSGGSAASGTTSP